MPYLNYATAVREGRLAEYEAQRAVSRGAYEERRGTRVEALKKELIRDNVFDPRKLDNVLYYTNVEEQNMFLDSITNGQMFGRSEFGYWKDLEPVMYLGQALKLLNSRFTKEFGIPLILPKFSNLNNISVKEQQFLAMQGLIVEKDRKGRYGVGIAGNTRKLFENIEATGGKSGAYYQFTEPSEYYISIGAVPEHLLREIEVHGAVSGTGFKRGRGYVGDEPEVTTDYIQPQITPTSTQKKPESVFQPPEPEPEITTDHIQPQITPSSTQKKPGSVFQPPEPEPEVITAHIEPPVEAEPEKLYEVYGQTLPLSESAVDYYESLGVSVTTSQVDPPIAEPEPQVTTSQVEPPVEEVTEPITSQVEPQEVTAQISWFGNTWFPWHLELEDRRRR